MEAAFANLEKQGKTDVESLVKWMKDSKVIDKSNEQEEKARSFFSDVGDKNKVRLDEFKDAMMKVSEEFQKNLDGIMKQLTDFDPKILGNVRDGATNTTNTLTSFGETLKDFMGHRKL